MSRSMWTGSMYICPCGNRDTYLGHKVQYGTMTQKDLHHFLDMGAGLSEHECHKPTSSWIGAYLCTGSWQKPNKAQHLHRDAECTWIRTPDHKPPVSKNPKPKPYTLASTQESPLF